MKHSTKPLYHEGMRVGHLVILEKRKNAKGKPEYVCQCDCGNTCIKSAGQMSKACHDHIGDSCGCQYKKTWGHICIGNKQTYAENVQAYKKTSRRDDSSAGRNSSTGQFYHI